MDAEICSSIFDAHYIAWTRRTGDVHATLPTLVVTSGDKAFRVPHRKSIERHPIEAFPPGIIATSCTFRTPANTSNAGKPIDRSGISDPYPYHVLGLSWGRATASIVEEKRRNSYLGWWVPSRRLSWPVLV